ncbi:STAS domain-containing protein [Microbacterium oryzae]|uniref:Anti-sigma factor antagonist n=1 Tax=Microbacterium oryzae TaxID=743009 RepID=A0A6I6DZ45_9MICO|nr:STAS domain-containing protein [Microbacterium oryzae]MDN3312088.1 STAS domain-containing protein [Microbacterium oryzae]QGU27234.1 anti-sigma factor antagonist [Microbacterium oryzae]
MNLTTDIRRRYAVVTITGRLTASGAPRLRDAVKELVDAGHAQIVVDLGATEFVDSSGLGALISGLKTARVAGGDLRIAQVPAGVRSVMKLTNLDRVLREHESVESAFDVR